MNVTRTFDILEWYQNNFTKDDALAGKVKSEWIKYSTQQYVEYSNNFSYGLLALGFKKGDKIATVSNNRPEWNFVDMGMAQIGIVHIPIYPTISEEDYMHILKHSEAKSIIISDKLLYYKLKPIIDKIITKGKELSFIKKALFFWAVNLGLKYKLNQENGWWYEFKLKIANKLIFSKWREALGGNVKVIVSGGAALQPRLEKIFWAARIPVVEGYGLTETSPVIASNHYTYPDIKFGTVGLVLNGIEVKIDEDGEILCKGPNVMLGYYKDPEYTKQVIDSEGWLHTGDIGIFEDNKFLKITDRKKEIFKTSYGKYVAPQVIENKFKESLFIEQIIICGENEKFVSALISPNFPFLHDWCSMNIGLQPLLQFHNNKQLISIPNVIARYQKEIDNYNKSLGQTEQIKKFRLVPDEWRVETGELSPTLKLKRKFIAEKYKELVEQIYREA